MNTGMRQTGPRRNGQKAERRDRFMDQLRPGTWPGRPRSMYADADQPVVQPTSRKA